MQTEIIIFWIVFSLVVNIILGIIGYLIIFPKK
jgi:hypothetical protein